VFAGGGALGCGWTVILCSVTRFFLKRWTLLAFIALRIGRRWCAVRRVCSIIYKLSNRQGQLPLSRYYWQHCRKRDSGFFNIGVFDVGAAVDQRTKRAHLLRRWVTVCLATLVINIPCVNTDIPLALLVFSPACLSHSTLYLLGEAQAQHLGIEVSKLKKHVLFITPWPSVLPISIRGMIGCCRFCCAALKNFDRAWFIVFNALSVCCLVPVFDH